MHASHRRAAIEQAAVGFAACPDVGPELIGRETSPRIMRLRFIFARMIEVHHAAATATGEISRRLHSELDALTDEVGTIAECVWASPLQSATDILERALVSAADA